jgi:hypothetical protein
MKLPEAVYLLCTLTSITCAVLLGTAYSRSKARVLLWTCLCFIMLALNNILLYLDLSVFGPELDLSVERDITAFLGLALLVFGLIWDAD